MLSIAFCLLLSDDLRPRIISLVRAEWEGVEQAVELLGGVRFELVDDEVRQRGRVLRLEREPPVDESAQADTESKNVDTFVYRIVVQLLGRHVIGSADRFAGGLDIFVDHLGKTAGKFSGTTVFASESAFESIEDALAAI